MMRCDAVSARTLAAKVLCRSVQGLCLVLVLALTPGCKIFVTAPQQPPIPPGAQQPGLPPGVFPPGGPLAPTTSNTTATAPTTNTTATSNNPTGAPVAVAITSAAPGQVQGLVSNLDQSVTLNLRPTALRVDLLAADGTTVLGTATPDLSTGTAASGGSCNFTINSATPLTVGATVAARASVDYSGTPKVATSTPVQVQAAPAAPTTGTTPTSVTNPTGTTTTTSTLVANITGPNSVLVGFQGFPPSTTIQVSMTEPGGTIVGPVATSSDATGTGQVTLTANPALGPGQSVTVNAFAANGFNQTVSATWSTGQ